jgi:hypothetical protein
MKRGVKSVILKLRVVSDWKEKLEKEAEGLGISTSELVRRRVDGTSIMALPTAGLEDQSKKVVVGRVVHRSSSGVSSTYEIRMRKVAGKIPSRKKVKVADAP